MKSGECVNVSEPAEKQFPANATDGPTADTTTQEECMNSEKPKIKTEFNYGGVRWAPLTTPLHRRRQTFAVVAMFYLVSMFSMGLSLFLLRSSGLPFVLFIAYLTYVMLFQDFQFKGGLGSQWYRNMAIWRWLRDYFPISLERTVEIPNDKSYIFGYHPHGIISIGSIVNFGTNATGFDKLFPGINLRLLTLGTNFRVPFQSLHFGLLGLADSGKESINYVLEKGNGNSVMLVLGGAKEALDARPGQYTLTLKSRKGFVKLALRNGAHLVPVFSFGENDLFDQVDNPRGSRLRKWQGILQAKLGFSLPLVKGRGIFNYSFGLLPHRRPVVSVVGKPIPVPKVAPENMTQEVIDLYHSRYIEGLQEVYETFKSTHSSDKESTLCFAD